MCMPYALVSLSVCVIYFATDCPCGVWCRGLTTCMLVHFLELSFK